MLKTFLDRSRNKASWPQFAGERLWRSPRIFQSDLPGGVVAQGRARDRSHYRNSNKHVAPKSASKASVGGGAGDDRTSDVRMD